MPLMSDPAAETPTPHKERRFLKHSEVNERISLAQDLLARGWHASAVKAEFRKRYGKVSKSAVGRYMGRARAREAALVARGRDMMRDDCQKTLNWIIRTAPEYRDVTAAVKAKLDAYGLNIKLPPVEAVCEAAGITVDQFYSALATATGRDVPDTPEVAGPGAEPRAV